MDWTPLHARLHRTLRQRQLLEPNQRILVAVSGGQDSLCLIKLLLDLQPKWGWQLAIAHCDHRWRSDSEANAAYVEGLAQAWQTPYYLQTTVQAASTEAQARHWRYEALATIARENHYPYLLTGHTASDRAETLIFNLIRGSGADGLQALTWKRPLCKNLQLIRPLLETTRAETAQFCQDLNLAVWEDSTNENLKHARNRIRQELLPYLQAHFNPQVEQCLAQTAEILSAEVEYLESAATVWLKKVKLPLVISKDYPYQLGLNRLHLREAPLALRRRVIRQFLKQALQSNPSFAQIEKVAALIEAPNRSRSDPFPGNFIVEVEDSWLWWKKL